ncbi:hypothetical protein [Variovorax sp. OK605]|uniref:hypothetical protein n=1 Tax=Variovorax sp. OK605 TaxID=1855317 RepID=UPI000B846580|nr:hypothetical protein [Variovorax sp. OK605]
MNKFGRVLKSVCVFWCMAAVGNGVLSAIAGRPSRVMMHVLLLALGVIVFLIGSWLSKRSSERTVRAVKARWWQSDYGFRLAIFLSISWMVGSFLWQESYDRNYSVVLGPAIFLIAMYFAYKLFVAPRPANGEGHEEILDSAPAAVETDVAVQHLETSSVDRQRAMDDLIKRMNAK